MLVTDSGTALRMCGRAVALVCTLFLSASALVTRPPPRTRVCIFRCVRIWVVVRVSLLVEVLQTPCSSYCCGWSSLVLPASYFVFLSFFVLSPPSVSVPSRLPSPPPFRLSSMFSNISFCLHCMQPLATTRLDLLRSYSSHMWYLLHSLPSVNSFFATTTPSLFYFLYEPSLRSTSLVVLTHRKVPRAVL